MEENEKGGYSAEGRKLRPRRQRIQSSYEGRYGASSEGREYSSSEEYGHSYSSSEGRGYRTDYHNQEGRGDYHQHRSYGNREERGYGSSSGRYGRSQKPSSGYGRGGYGRSDSEYQQHKSYGSREGRSYGSSSGRYGRSQKPSSGYGRGGYGRNDSEYQQHKSYGSREDGSYGSSSERYGRGQRPGYGERKPYGKGGYNSSEGRKGGYSPSDKKGGRGDKGGFRKNAGARNSDFQSQYTFDKSSAEGINRMLSRKPIIDQSQASEVENVQTDLKEEIRLNKFIANSGVCSRREADQFILAGVVTVNDEVVTELGTKVNMLSDEVKFNGETIRGEKKVYIVMNKPKGYVTTSSDPHAEKTVLDLLKGCTYRVFPVGRLDKSTTGVLMFTNDGDIAEKLTHPSYDKKKIYQVILNNPLTDEHKEKILSGISLNDGEVKADELEYIDEEDHRKLGIEIHSGKNRIVRRIFESLGYEVKALDRVYFAGLTKKGLKKGEWRYLSDGEANLLKMGAYI